VLREKLAGDDSPEGRIASLQPGDQISDAFRANRPWVVEESKAGGLQLRSGNASPLPLDRMSPSPRILKLVTDGKLTQERPITEGDVSHVAYESPHVAYRDDLVDQVRRIASGEKQVPDPKTKVQARAQGVAAERRTDAAISKATGSQADAIEPPPGTTVKEAENKADEAAQDAKTAETAYAQEAAAKAKQTAADAFPERAPVSVGLSGHSGHLSRTGESFHSTTRWFRSKRWLLRIRGKERGK